MTTRTPLFVVSFVVALTWVLPARADQCGDIRNHIAQLDQLIAKDHIRDSRELRMRDRSNWARAYNEICTGSRGGYSGGGISSRDRKAATLGAAIGVIGTLRDILRESEMREQQAAQEQQRAWEQQEAMARAQRESEELERQRKAAAERAADDARRQALANPFAPGGATGLDPANPFAVPSKAPAVAQVPASGFRTDEEIKAMCASHANPSACEMGEQSARNFNPAYQQWRREASRIQDRNIEAAEAELDRAIEEHRRKRAEAADTPGDSNFPIAAFEQAPTPRGKDGYEECRKGAARPDTVVSCYEQPVGTTESPKAQPGAGSSSADGKEARRRLMGALSRRTLRGNAGSQPDQEPAEHVVQDEPPADADSPLPDVQVAAASSIVDPGPPFGYRREVIDEALCKQWLGNFFTPPGSSIPVCEYPDNPYGNVEGENERIVRDLVDEGERELEIGPYARPSN